MIQMLKNNQDLLNSLLELSPGEEISFSFPTTREAKRARFRLYNCFRVIREEPEASGPYTKIPSKVKLSIDSNTLRATATSSQTVEAEKNSTLPIFLRSWNNVKKFFRRPLSIPIKEWDARTNDFVIKGYNEIKSTDVTLPQEFQADEEMIQELLNLHANNLPFIFFPQTSVTFEQNADGNDTFLIEPVRTR